LALAGAMMSTRTPRRDAPTSAEPYNVAFQSASGTVMTEPGGISE